MRYGSSGNLTATQPNKTGIETIEKLKKFGYDYIELPLSEIMDLPPEQREAIVTRVEAFGRRPCNMSRYRTSSPC